MESLVLLVDELLEEKVKALNSMLSHTKFDWDIEAVEGKKVMVRLESETHFNLKPKILKALEDKLASSEKAKMVFEQQVFRMVGDDGFYDINHSGLIITNEETTSSQKQMDRFFAIAKRNDSVQHQVTDFILKIIDRY